MWVARLKLKDDEDIYSPLCIKYKMEFFAVPYTHYTKKKKVNLLVGGIISGTKENKNAFEKGLLQDKRVQKIERYRDFIIVHAQHPLSREARAEIRVFYNPQYVRVKPVHVASDGWEYWAVASTNRNELNKLVQAARKHYHGILFSMKQETLHGVTSLQLAPLLTEKQLEAVKIAFKEGYYEYPRQLTLPELAQALKKSYSTFHEHLSRAENKLIEYFLRYR